MKKYFFFLLFGCCSNLLLAQVNYFPTEHYEIKPLEINMLFPVNIYSTSIIASTSVMSSNKLMNVSAYNYDDLAIFCKLEVKMEKASGFPVKFRLGEVNDVERLEGKPYSIFY